MKDVILTFGRYLGGMIGLLFIAAGLVGCLFAIFLVGAGLGVGICAVAGVSGPTLIPLICGSAFSGAAIALVGLAVLEGEA